LGSRLILDWTSRECNRYLVEGGDIAVIPVGSVEVLGPHLPMGARCFLAEAFATLLAEQVEGIHMPVTPFSSALNTFDRAGSVALPEEVVNNYVRATMDDLLAGGFRRILLVTHLDYLRYYIPQEFYEDHGVAAAGIHIGEAVHEFAGDASVGEDSLIVGALHVLGRGDLARRVLTENKRLLDGGFAKAELSPALARLRRSGRIGFTYPVGAYPMPPNPELSAERGEEALRKTVAALVPAVQSLREYNEFLAKRWKSRGLMWRGWRWAE